MKRKDEDHEKFFQTLSVAALMLPYASMNPAFGESVTVTIQGYGGGIRNKEEISFTRKDAGEEEQVEFDLTSVVDIYGCRNKPHPFLPVTTQGIPTIRNLKTVIENEWKILTEQQHYYYEREEVNDEHELEDGGAYYLLVRIRK